MSEKIIVVVGVTGAQGVAIARHFAAKPGWRVRGVTRDPTRASSAWLRELGVELVAANLNVPSELDAAFAGAHAIYGVTNFWAELKSKATLDLAARDNIPSNQACMRIEVQQGKNLADAALRVRRQGTLERYIWSTLSDTLRWSGGDVTENYHFDGKVQVEHYIRRALPDLANVASYLMVGFYASNWKIGAFGPIKQPDGTWTHTAIQVPGYADASYPIVVPQSDNGIYVDGLLSAPPGTTLLGHSHFGTIRDFAAGWARATGLTCNVAYRTPAQALAQDASDVAREIVATNVYAIKFGYQGHAPDLKLPADIGIHVARLTTLEQFMQTEDWSDLIQFGGRDTINEIVE